MNNQIATPPTQQTLDETEILRKVIAKGDLADLTPEQQLRYYLKICEQHKLNPYSKPFDLVETTDKQGRKKVTLYGNKECAAQLGTDREVSIYKIDESEENGFYKVIVYARLPNGRESIDIGVTPVRGLSGESYANALKRAVTQGKRRVTLSICGLGCPDESEIESVPGAVRLPDSTQELNVIGDDNEHEIDEEVTISRKSSGLDQWRCGRGLAMQIISLSTNLKAKGVTDEVIKSWLPPGFESRKDLEGELAIEFAKNLHSRIKLIEICAALAARGVDKETMSMRLPGGVRSLKDLSPEQVAEAIKAFTNWLNSYDEITVNEYGEAA